DLGQAVAKAALGPGLDRQDIDNAIALILVQTVGEQDLDLCLSRLVFGLDRVAQEAIVVFFRLGDGGGLLRVIGPCRTNQQQRRDHEREQWHDADPLRKTGEVACQFKLGTGMAGGRSCVHISSSGVSNSRSPLAGTMAQAPEASSSSSWPGPQPA